MFKIHKHPEAKTYLSPIKVLRKTSDNKTLQKNPTLRGKCCVQIISSPAQPLPLCSNSHSRWRLVQVEAKSDSQQVN